MQNPSLANIITTLVANGFNVEKVNRLPHRNTIVYTYKYEKLGAKVSYNILFSEDKDESPIIDSLIAGANKFNATPLIVADDLQTSKCKTYNNKEFFNFFGGILNTGLVLIPNLSNLLDELGHNKLPIGLVGNADDLHEIYVKECLQFIMESPTRRYGIDRSFESLPDAVVLSKQHFMILLDSKAYANGFEFKADDLKRFCSYIEDFRSRYLMFFGNIFSFVVVSGHFNDSENALEGRSEELYKMCNCKLSCIKSKELGEITQILRANFAQRASINWKNIFSELFIDTKLVKKELTRIKKDNLH